MLILGAILAGGQASRFGGPKGLALVAGITCVRRVRTVLDQGCETVVISIGGKDQEDMTARHPDLAEIEVVSDIRSHAGPVAALEAILEYARKKGADGVIAAAWDCPFLPQDMVSHLLAHRRTGAHPVMALSGERAHPTAAFWPVAALPNVSQYLDAGQRRLTGLMDDLGATHAHWPEGPFDPFFNINTQHDLLEANRIAGHYQL